MISIPSKPATALEQQGTPAIKYTLQAGRRWTRGEKASLAESGSSAVCPGTPGAKWVLSGRCREKEPQTPGNKWIPPDWLGVECVLVIPMPSRLRQEDPELKLTVPAPEHLPSDSLRPAHFCSVSPTR